MRSAADLRVWLVDFGQGALGALRRLPHVQAYVTDEERFLQVADEIDRALESRRARTQELEGPSSDGAGPVLVLAFDDFDLFRGAISDGTLLRLEHWVRRCRGLGLHLMVAGPTEALDQYDGLSKALKECQTGVILGTGDLDLFGVRSVTADRPLLPGQGYYVHRGEVRAIKAATPHAGSLSLPDWVQALRRRCEVRA